MVNNGLVRMDGNIMKYLYHLCCESPIFRIRLGHVGNISDYVCTYVYIYIDVSEVMGVPQWLLGI